MRAKLILGNHLAIFLLIFIDEMVTCRSKAPVAVCFSDVSLISHGRNATWRNRDRQSGFTATHPAKFKCLQKHSTEVKPS